MAKARFTTLAGNEYRADYPIWLLWLMFASYTAVYICFLWAVYMWGSLHPAFPVATVTVTHTMAYTTFDTLSIHAVTATPVQAVQRDIIATHCWDSAYGGCRTPHTTFPSFNVTAMTFPTLTASNHSTSATSPHLIGATLMADLIVPGPSMPCPNRVCNDLCTPGAKSVTCSKAPTSTSPPSHL